MPITVVGSIAYDTVKTPFGERERMLGGAAVHFALAASFFDDVRVVGPVGEDFGERQLAIVRTRGVDVSDVELVAGGKTFFWQGEYGWDLNSRETLDTQLGVFEGFENDHSRAFAEDKSAALGVEWPAGFCAVLEVSQPSFSGSAFSASLRNRVRMRPDSSAGRPIDVKFNFLTSYRAINLGRSPL